MHSDHSRIKRCDANTELWNSGIETNKAIVRDRKRKVRYISNILVISDPKNKTAEGKVFLFGFGAKIFEKIMGAIKPEFEDEATFNPFDFWSGAPFKLKIRNYEGYRNYDKSEFDACTPLFSDDAAIENVWKSEHSLAAFVEPKEFKGYDVLKSKFSTIVGNVSSYSIGSIQEEHFPEDPADEIVAANDPISQQKKPETKSGTAEEDDFDMYRSLLED